jgi:aminopeptidase YwaD
MTSMGLSPFHGDGFELRYLMPHPMGKKPQKFTNLIGVIPGRDRSLPPILLGAHYDSVIDAPCVDDNATSVAHNLMLASHYACHPLERDLVIAFFDAEEPPHYLGKTMGSRRFVEDYCADIRFAAAIITDLVGHDASDCDLPIPGIAKTFLPGLKKLVAVVGAETDGTFPVIVEDAAKKAKGLRVISTLYDYVGPVSDHAAFAKAGQPFLFLSCGQGRHYHSPEDTMEWINFDKLAHITRFIGELVEQIDRTPADADRVPTDFFDTELRMWNKALGLALPLAMKYLGLKMPQTREELNDLVEHVGNGGLAN